MNFENKGPEMLNDVDALADRKNSRGTYVEIEKKRAMDVSGRELFSNKKQVLQYVSDKPISTDACVNISNTNSINATYLELGKEKGKVILMGDNSGKGKNPLNHDKDIGVGSKNKVQNTFPTHVKSFLSSGLLDGVPVKYSSMSSEKSLIGVIEGKGCLCSYDNYKLSEKMKYLSASEFERHAGCKGGHANSHIYFDSGKTIHVVAQNLKKTPPEMLFESIQKFVGCPINPKKFQTFNDKYMSTYKVLKNIILQKMKRQNHCDLLIDQGRGSSTISQ